MSKTVFVVLAGFLLVASCKRCYECHQYCAYCQSKSNTALVYKVCASKDGTTHQIDSVLHAFPDSLYTCTLYNDNRDVCDHANQVDEAAAYFQKQDYYCFPK